MEMLRGKHRARAVPHALLVSGGTAPARLDFALEAAMLLLDGDRTDLVMVEPDDGQIKVDAVRELIERLRLKPFSASRTVAVVVDGDLMNPQAQNKLLKTLEEPSGDSVIMILVANTEALRATIRSRCMKISLGADAVQTAAEVEADAVKALSAALFGKPAQEAFAIVDAHMDDPFPLLDAMEMFLRDLIVGQRSPDLATCEEHRRAALRMRGRADAGLGAGIEAIEDTRAALSRGRMNRKGSLHDMVLRLRAGGEIL
jgi:hypothetical protein